MLDCRLKNEGPGPSLQLAKVFQDEVSVLLGQNMYSASLLYPKHSMYGIFAVQEFTNIGVISGVHVGISSSPMECRV